MRSFILAAAAAALLVSPGDGLNRTSFDGVEYSDLVATEENTWISSNHPDRTSPKNAFADAGGAGRPFLSRFGATHAVRGMMFDVTAKTAVTLNGLDLNLLSTDELLNVTLYRKKSKGPWDGSAHSPDEWKKVVQKDVMSTGQDKPSRFWRRGNEITLAAGETQAFYIWVEDSRRSLLVIAGNNHTNTATSNFDLDINPVIISTARFNKFFQYWIFNGRLRYSHQDRNSRIHNAQPDEPDKQFNDRISNDQSDERNSELARDLAVSLVKTDHMEATHYEMGVVFKVRAMTPITVVNLQLYFRYEQQETVHVWTKNEGGYSASTFNRETWEYLGTTVVEARNGLECDCLTPLPVGSIKGASIAKGGVRSFYVTLKDNRNMLISNKRATGDVSGKNSKEAVLVVGCSVKDKFGSLFRDFEWIGGVEYVKGGMSDGRRLQEQH